MLLRDAAAATRLNLHQSDGGEIRCGQEEVCGRPQHTLAPPTPVQYVACVSDCSQRYLGVQTVSCCAILSTCSLPLLWRFSFFKKVLSFYKSVKSFISTGSQFIKEGKKNLLHYIFSRYYNIKNVSLYKTKLFLCKNYFKLNITTHNIKCFYVLMRT